MPLEILVVLELGEHFLQSRHQAVPVRAQRQHDDRMRHDRRRPLHGVDLGHQGADDEPCLVEELLIVPRGELLRQPIADRVVFQGKEAVQQAERHPGVLRHAGDLEPRHRVQAEPAVVADLDLALCARPERGLHGGRAAVNLRAVPPVRVVVDVGRRPLGIRPLLRIDRRLGQPHRPLRPGIAVFQRDLMGAVHRALPVEEPVVGLELDPRRGHHVQDRDRLELRPA